MKNITLVIVMIVAAIAGYFIGSYSGRNAKEALANALVAARLATDDHDKTVKELNNRIIKLDSDYEIDKKARDASYEKQKVKWAGLLAGRDKRITELSKESSGTGAEIERLRGSLKGMTSPEERQRMNERIAKLEKELKDQQILITGLECSKIPVPQEILSKLKGDAL
jgi:uncharacterized coiled-coil protein SlyX